MKQYITYTRFLTRNNREDPTNAMNYLWKDIFSITETAYNGLGNSDARFIAILEYEDTVEQKLIDRMMLNFTYHMFTMVTPEKALEFCNEWYPSDTDAYFALDSDNFTLIDNRPVEEDLI